MLLSQVGGGVAFRRLPNGCCVSHDGSLSSLCLGIARALGLYRCLFFAQDRNGPMRYPPLIDMSVESGTVEQAIEAKTATLPTYKSPPPPITESSLFEDGQALGPLPLNALNSPRALALLSARGRPNGRTPSQYSMASTARVSPRQSSPRRASSPRGARGASASGSAGPGLSLSGPQAMSPGGKL